MRYESETLIAEQKKMTVEPWIEIVLTQGENQYSYYRTRILGIEHNEQPYSHKAELVLQNADKELTAIDLKGYEASIAYGLVTEEGEEVSETAPLTVIGQRFDSSPGKLNCTLELVGIPNLLAEDKASESYVPDENDNKTVKTLITEILGATLAPFNHCKAYEITWGSGTGAGSLINDYIPKDGFRIYVNNSRLSVLRRLLDWTKCMMLFRAGGEIKIFQPKTTGEDYDYEYSLTGEDAHTFFAKAYRNRIVIPNVVVVMSEDDDDPWCAGDAEDEESIIALGGREFRQFEQCTLKDDQQASDIAEAILSKYRLHAEAGAASVPMNVCAEVFDYVKVSDQRESEDPEENYRVGNIGSLTRIYKPGQYEMRFSFGGWLSVRQMVADLETHPSGFGSAGQYFSRLQAKHAYIENLLVTNIDAAWIDPEGNVDLSQIGDTLDNLPDGEVYARVKLLHIDAGNIKLDDKIIYASGYDPTKKMPGDADLDYIPNGVTYSRVLTTDISAGHIKLSSVVQTSSYRTVSDSEKGSWDGKPEDMDDIGEGATYGRVKQTQISAGEIVLTSASFKIDKTGVITGTEESSRVELTSAGLKGYKSDVLQVEIKSSDGKIYAAAGTVIIDVDGITITEEKLLLKDGDTIIGYLGCVGTAGSQNVRLRSLADRNITLMPSADLNLQSASGDVFIDPLEDAKRVKVNQLDTTVSTTLITIGTNYQNTTGKLLFATVSVLLHSGEYASLRIGATSPPGTEVAYIQSGADEQVLSMAAIVPVGYYWKVVSDGQMVKSTTETIG